MESKNTLNSVILGLSICIGLSIAGISIGIGQYKARTADRYVSVKGLSEREVDSDLAIWPITFQVTDKELHPLQKKIEENRKTVKFFLKNAGFEENEISYSGIRIQDFQSPRQNDRIVRFNYIAYTTVTVRSNKVLLVKKSMEMTGDLVGKGIIFGRESWRGNTEFSFNKLNDIKPMMIEEATKNARKSAEKFAEDSGSQVGKIRHASQGLFSIRNRDKNSPERKIVRVVSTIQYYLE